MISPNDPENSDDLAHYPSLTEEREVMTFDALIVGGGVAGLGCAIRLKQLQPELSICVIEKGRDFGAHTLSGALLETRALAELFPNLQQLDAPLHVPVIEHQFRFLTEKSSWRLPNPPAMRNKGAYIIRPGVFVKWLAVQAEMLGVEVYAGFAGAEILYDNDDSGSHSGDSTKQGRVAGVATGDVGIGRDGIKTERFSRGVELRARQTIFAEGCHGSLTKIISSRFNLRADCQPQTYGLGVKEVWRVNPAKHRQGLAQHMIGWPLTSDTYGGGWIYHGEDNTVSIGMVVGLDYSNPTLSPFEEMQRFKQHPSIRPLLEGGSRLAYGARALVEGGLQSIPRLTFPGGLLIGDTAGFVNVPKIKGLHTAMKSGIVAAEAVAEHLSNNRNNTKDKNSNEVTSYPLLLRKSWLWQELWQVRNIRPSFRAGRLFGIIYSALDSFVLKGRVPWTLRHHADHKSLRNINHVKKLKYPKPDGAISFDRLSSVYLSNTNHEENQPCHLRLRDHTVAIKVNLQHYGAPETLYCPAGVYEIVKDANGNNPHLVINAVNCVHCKTCDIKDPTQNIDWVTPEGGGGPDYSGH